MYTKTIGYIEEESKETKTRDSYHNELHKDFKWWERDKPRVFAKGRVCKICERFLNMYHEKLICDNCIKKEWLKQCEIEWVKELKYHL